MARREELKGKVAIVTGASSGVGWRSAVRLAQAGVRLCVTARRREALEALQKVVVDAGGECLVVPGDVTDEMDVRWVVSACLQRYGRIDILVNDAAVRTHGDVDTSPGEHLQRTMDVARPGFLRFVHAVLPQFRAQGSGHILNLQSMLSEGAAPRLSADTAAKHGPLGWAKALKRELHGTGIEVSNVLVPSVATPMFDDAPTQPGHEPVPPTSDVDRVARAVVRCARRPGRTERPAFLQGTLLWLAPAVGNFVMGRYGARMRRAPEPLERSDGVGAYGSVPPTPRWKRFTAVMGLAALAGGLLGGAALGARGLARGVR